ncbi:alpha-mannosidase, partial [Saccharopolyspora terrae]
MHDDRHIVEQRLDRVLHQRIKPAQHTHTLPMDIAVWHTPGEPVPVDQALAATYQPTHIGQPWGPAWGTAWFRLTATIPETWAGHTVEALINLGSTDERPGFQCEGLCYTPDGTPLKAINPLNTYLPLPSTPGTHTIYVEAAANPDILG